MIAVDGIGCCQDGAEPLFIQNNSGVCWMTIDNLGVLLTLNGCNNTGSTGLMKNPREPAPRDDV